MSSRFNKHRCNSSWNPRRGAIVLLGLLLAVLAALAPPFPAWAQGPEAGRRIAIRIEGNRSLSERTLRRAADTELAAFIQNDGREADLADAAFQMELAYRAEGYAFAEAAYDLVVRDTALQAVIRIEEGPQVALTEITFPGRSEVPAEALEALVLSSGGLFGAQDFRPFVRARIDAGAARIRDFYLARGYLDVTVGEPRLDFAEDRRRVQVALPIDEGRRYRLTALKFSGDLPQAAADDLRALRDELLGTPYNRSQRLVVSSRLEEIYGNLGYADMLATLEEERLPPPRGILLTAEITSGEVVTIEAVNVAGNAKTSTAFIRRRVQLEPGDRYSLTARRESFRTLYRTGLFTRVDLALAEAQAPGGRDLVVTVEEGPSREFFIEPGWGSYELLRLKLGLREKNLFGSGRTLGIETSVSAKSRQATLSLVDPWFLNTEVTADFPLYYSYREEPSFTREDIGLSTSFSRPFGDHLSGTAAYTLRNTDISDVDADAGDEVVEETYNFASVKGQVTYDDRDDPFYPTRGRRFTLGLEHADQALGGEITFSRFTAGVRYFHAFDPDTVLGLRYAAGFIYPGGGEGTVPIGERFFNGGENSVRSFRQSELGPKDLSGDPVGGLAFNTVNVELRRRLVGDLSGTLFFDLGNVAPNRSYTERGRRVPESSSEAVSDTLDDFFSDFRYGVGVGLQYKLPIGPLRADLAFNPDADEDRDEDGWVFHFSVGMAF